MQVLLLVSPVPRSYDDVALDALRPRGLAVRQFAFGDAIGPIAEIFVGRATEIAGQRVDHERRGLARHGTAAPGVLARLELTERGRDGTGRFLAELMAADAGPILQHRQPFALRDLLGDVALAAELARVRNLQHRVPVDCRIILCGFLVARCRRGTQIDDLAGLALDLRRIDETVTAHPDVVFAFRQIGHHVSALIVGDDHLGVARRQIVRFRNYPDAGFGAACAGDHAADVIAVDDHAGRCLLGAQLCGWRREQDSETDRRHAQI